MKKIISILLLVLMLFAHVNVSATNTISVELDADKLEFDAPPVNINDRVLVPVRAIFEAMGATVLWDATAKTVTSTLGDTTVVMTIDSTSMTVNNEEKTLDVAPTIISDRTMVPARAVAEAFGATVEWDAPNNTVEIFTDDFLSRTEKMQTHRSTKDLSSESVKATSDFSILYFDEAQYKVRINANDGTDFEIESPHDDTLPYYAVMSVRADVYTGTEYPMTDEYAQSMAESTAQVVSGTLVYGKVTTIGKDKFIEIHYTKPATSGNIDDHEAEVLIYTTVKGGIVYTMTYTHYGVVPESINADINYMMNTLIIH